MFSWIIEKKSRILEINDWNFVVENNFSEPLQIGQSIAHDWACMTITSFDLEKYSFFAMQETLNLTNFNTKKPWDFFNVERCIKLWDRLDWHMVSWHIDTVWEVSELVKNSDGSLWVYINYDKNFSKYIITKWSITINWTSLTIILDEPWKLWVSLIPITQEITNLWELKLWDKVNLEFDLVGKYIFKNSPHPKSFS